MPSTIITKSIGLDGKEVIVAHPVPQPPLATPTLSRRRHIDLLRIVSAACR